MCMPSFSKYKLLFIDADDTLYDFTQCERNALIKTYREFSVDPLEEHIDKYHTYNKKLWKDLEKGLVNQNEIKHERFRLLVEDRKWPVNFMDMSLQYIRNISEERILMNDAEDVCNYLHQKYTLIMLTNGISEIQRGRFEPSVIRKYFSKLVISDEACCSKPDPGIFEWALQDTAFSDSDKKEMLIIGDNLSSDIQGGINFGIDTCWLNPNGTPSIELRPSYEIRNLMDLKKML